MRRLWWDFEELQWVFLWKSGKVVGYRAPVWANKTWESRRGNYLESVDMGSNFESLNMGFFRGSYYLGSLRLGKTPYVNCSIATNSHMWKSYQMRELSLLIYQLQIKTLGDKCLEKIVANFTSARFLGWGAKTTFAMPVFWKRLLKTTMLMLLASISSFPFVFLWWRDKSAGVGGVLIVQSVSEK